MKQLIFTVGWLEFTRTKTRNWLLLLLILGSAFLLLSYGDSVAGFQKHHQDDRSDFELISPERLADKRGISNEFVNLASIPTAAVTAAVGFFGFIVLLTIPFRSRQEWEDGQFQMISMGRFNFYQVESARFLSYLSLAVLYYFALLGTSSLYAWLSGVSSMQGIKTMNLLISYFFLALVPLMLSFGIFVSAINTAYYRDGGGKLLTLVKYVSCFCFFVLVLKVFRGVVDRETILFPTLDLHIEIENFFEHTARLNFEFLLISLSSAAALLFWSARIMEEVED
ncbi:hypothetical protein SAMN02745866_01453 [Alteromonadaceae bacterium Bs31]|nr:hypothetical protein SAMN02745866_01453 [Alteromonadaceae bacterium Bs31]